MIRDFRAVIHLLIALETIKTYNLLLEVLQKILITITDQANFEPRGKLLDFLNCGANVVIWGLPFGVGEIIWCLKF